MRYAAPPSRGARHDKKLVVKDGHTGKRGWGSGDQEGGKKERGAVEGEGRGRRGGDKWIGVWVGGGGGGPRARAREEEEGWWGWAEACEYWWGEGGRSRVKMCGWGRRRPWSALDRGTNERGGLGQSRGNGRAGLRVTSGNADISTSA